MSVQVPQGSLFLGNDRDNDPVLYPSSFLTTHGVIVGMTGSGKTGLGVIMIEEALLSGIPALVIDPKGDMGNLALMFSKFDAAAFAPWAGEEDPASIATTWAAGLAKDGVGQHRITALCDQSSTTIYTPGSTSGMPLNMVGTIKVPTLTHDNEGALAEALDDEVESFVASLLSLIGIESDPLSGREHILLANIVKYHWQRGVDLNLETLIQAVLTPPFRKLGVMALDALFSQPDRQKLAIKLNGLAASPSFQAWAKGQPFDVEAMLFGPGPTRCAVVNIAHLTDSERQFAVTLILSKVISWMRTQSGSDRLRLLVYMDEVAGFAPPSAKPPSKKPILTILKQARAYGVGLVLATQNPVDLDYKAMSNAGTWLVGRLQTERDKSRLLDGMSRADGVEHIAELDAVISGLAKREFILHSTRSAAITFSTRWAISYLAGPLTQSQISELTETSRAQTQAEGDVSPRAEIDELSQPELHLDDTDTQVAPQVPEGIGVFYVNEDAEWIDEFVMAGAKTRLVAGLVARVSLLFDDARARLRHEAEWAAIARLDSSDPAKESTLEVRVDDGDLSPYAPKNCIYSIPQAPIHQKSYYSGFKARLRDRLHRELTLTLFRNSELGLFSLPGESQAEFKLRCETAGDDRAADQIEKLHRSSAAKRARFENDLSKLDDRIRELEHDHEAARNTTMAGAAIDALGTLFSGGRRSRATAGRRIVRGRQRAARIAERLETANHRHADKLADLNELEREVASDIDGLTLDWQEKAHMIELYEVTLEKNDIDVSDVSLVWIPTSR